MIQNEQRLTWFRINWLDKYSSQRNYLYARLKLSGYRVHLIILKDRYWLDTIFVKSRSKGMLQQSVDNIMDGYHRLLGPGSIIEVMDLW